MLSVPICDTLDAVIAHLDTHLEQPDYTTCVGAWFEYFVWTLFRTKSALAAQYETPLVISSTARNYYPEMRNYSASRTMLRALGLPEGDEGIDLLARRRVDGQWVAIQVKYSRARTQKLAWKHNLASFEALVGRAAVKQRSDGIVAGLLVTTSDRITKLSCNAVIGHLGGKDIDNEPGLVARTLSAMHGTTERPPQLVPRPHQQKIIEDVLRLYLTHDRCRICVATGAGKTLVARWIARGVEARRTLCLVPSLALLGQTFDEWTREAASREANRSHESREVTRDLEEPFHAPLCLLIGSDVELREGAPGLVRACTTSQIDIERFLEKNTKNTISTDNKDSTDGSIEVYCTYQSSGRLLAALDKRKDFVFDIVVFDEAHHTAGGVGMFNEFMRRGSAYVKKMLFQTATEKIINNDSEDTTDKDIVDSGENGEKAGSDLTDDDSGGGIISMGNEKLYGPLASLYGIEDGIRDGILCGYEIFVPTLTRGAVPHEIVDYVARLGYDFAGVRIPEQLLACTYLLLKVLSSAVARKVLSFSSLNNSAELIAHLAQLLVREGLFPSLRDKLYVCALSGKDNSARRAKELLAFEKAECGLLCSARIFREGVNLPFVDGICFADRKRSRLDIIQTIGRGLRKHATKKRLAVILPVVDAEEVRAGAVPEGGSLDDAKYIMRLLGVDPDNVFKVERQTHRGSEAHSDREVHSEARDDGIGGVTVVPYVWTSETLRELQIALVSPDQVEIELRTLAARLQRDMVCGAEFCDAWEKNMSQLRLAADELASRRGYKRYSGIPAPREGVYSISDLYALRQTVCGLRSEKLKLMVNFPLRGTGRTGGTGGTGTAEELLRRRYLETASLFTQSELVDQYRYHLERIVILRKLFAYLGVEQSTDEKSVTHSSVKATLGYLQQHRRDYELLFLDMLSPTILLDDLNALIGWLGCRIDVTGSRCNSPQYKISPVI